MANIFSQTGSIFSLNESLKIIKKGVEILIPSLSEERIIFYMVNLKPYTLREIGNVLEVILEFENGEITKEQKEKIRNLIKNYIWKYE